MGSASTTRDRLMFRPDLFIGGGWRPPASGQHVDVISPSTEAPAGSVPLATEADIDRAVTVAREAFERGPWPRMSPAERADVLDRAAASLREREGEIAAVTVDEMGCAISQAPQAQTGFTAALFDYYASLARTFEFSRTVVAASRAGLVDREPAGVVAVIVPWNAPVTLACWKAAPALAAGCPVIIKPPPEAPLSNFILADALAEAGLPEGVVSVVPAGREVGERLVTHPGTDKVAFTGSTAAGKRIMSLCGEQVKRVSLELGGKSAVVILDDADIATVIPRVVHGAMHLSGQVCGAHSRVLVPRPLYAAAVEAAAADAARVVTGDPHDPATLVGPLVARRQRDRVEAYIRLAVEAGATVAHGGGRPAGLPRGWYVEPTILAGVDNSMRVAREEIFGPVLCLIPYEGDDEAVAIANDSPYGLAGGVWSADPHRALAVARRLRTGSVAVNGAYPPFPLVPFGGFKESGLGRELGPEGLLSFLEPRSIGLPPQLHPQGNMADLCFLAMSIAQSVPIRPTRLTRWRLRSRTCAVADVAGTVAAVSLYLVAGIDSVVSWPSNRVLLSDGDLSHVAAVLLAPWWAWLIASAGMIGVRSRSSRSRRGRRRSPGVMRSPGDALPPQAVVLNWPAWALAGLVAGAAVALAVVAGGFAVGAAKGSVQVLPGPRYQVSTLDLNQADWTTVTASQFQLWQARFVREDAFFMFFGLIATVAFIGLLRLRRQPLPAAAADDGPTADGPTTGGLDQFNWR